VTGSPVSSRARYHRVALVCCECGRRGVFVYTLAELGAVLFDGAGACSACGCHALAVVPPGRAVNVTPAAEQQTLPGLEIDSGTAQDRR